MSEARIDPTSDTEYPILPSAFAELEPFITWALPTEEERYQKRLNSSMDDMREFYDAMVIRADDARKYLDHVDYPNLTPDAMRLLWMLFSLIVVSYAVDVFGQPRVPDSGSVYVRRTGEPISFPA
jgi:hypothetical protein